MLAKQMISVETTRRNTRDFVVRTRRAKGLFLMVAATMLQMTLAVHAAEKRPGMRAQLLPEGPNSTASVATCAVSIPDGGTVLIGGQIIDTGDYTVWRAAFWRSGNGGANGPYFLPDLGHGGRVNALSNNSWGGDAIYFAGTIFDDNGLEQPVVWGGSGYDFNPEEITLNVLPTNGAGGAALGVAVGDVNGDSVPEVVVSGFTSGAPQADTRAVVWTGTPEMGFSGDYLPPLVAGGDSVANVLVTSIPTPGIVIIVVLGSATDAAGSERAIVWEYVDDLVGWSFTDLGPSSALTVSNSNRILVAGGQAENSNGLPQPLMWEHNDVDGTWSHMRLLSMPDSRFNQGRVSSIICVLIGLVAVGDVSGPQGSSAALWQILSNGQLRAYDLNRIATGLPPGMRLTEANAALRFLDQPSWAAWIVGVANDANGTPHAFLGRVSSGLAGADHVRGSQLDGLP